MPPIRHRMARGLRRAAVIALVAMLAACSQQELYGQLSERQANEMVAVLHGAGLPAEKQAQQEGRFSVLTSGSRFADAVRTLNAQGYPRESYDSMGQVFKREGFVSSPLEERARLMHAMSQEISSTISSIDGVVTARVHLVVPERHPLADKAEPAAAAVFIKHRPERDLSAQIPQIKALVVNSIEGLGYDHVTVALFPAEALGSDALRPAPGRGSAVSTPLLAGGGFGGVLALVGGGLWWWRRRMPRVVTLPMRALGRSAPRIEPVVEAAAATPGARPGADAGSRP